MILKTYEDYKNHYQKGLALIKAYKIVTREVATELLGCNNDKLEPLTQLKLLYKTEIGIYHFYSTTSEKYSSRQIKRAILLTHFLMNKYENVKFLPNVQTHDNLFKKNVLYIGNTARYGINHYLMLGVNNRQWMHCDYKELINLVKEIYHTDGTDKIRIYFLHNYKNFNEKTYIEYFENDSELAALRPLLDIQSVIISLKNKEIDIKAMKVLK